MSRSGSVSGSGPEQRRSSSDSGSGPRLRWTTSLRRRLSLGGFALLVVLVLGLNVFVYLSLRDQLISNLDNVLSARAQLVTELAREYPPGVLEARLSTLGIRAEVRGGVNPPVISDPLLEHFDLLPPGAVASGQSDLVGRQIAFADGYTVTVYASRGGVDATLRRVLVLQGLGSLIVFVVAGLVLSRLSGLALRPLNEISAAARRILAGGAGQRLVVDAADPELAEMATTFNEMLDALEESIIEARRSERRSRRFLADAAHQLRTPVAAMRASVDALIRESSPDERERLIDNLLRETSRTSRLLASLLRMAELDHGEEPVRAPIDLDTVLREEARRAADLAPHLDVRVETDGVSEMVGDEFGLREAVANLLDNARRHARARVEVTAAKQDGRVTIRVVDDGDGVSDGDEERVFERFVTLDGGSGSGLGLPIVRAVARAHGGDVAYRDGAFVVDLPVQ